MERLVKLPAPGLRNWMRRYWQRCNDWLYFPPINRAIKKSPVGWCVVAVYFSAERIDASKGNILNDQVVSSSGATLLWGGRSGSYNGIRMMA
jgi:hypothetical protein